MLFIIFEKSGVWLHNDLGPYLCDFVARRKGEREILKNYIGDLTCTSTYLLNSSRSNLSRIFFLQICLPGFFRKETRSKILRSYARCSYENKTVRDSGQQESIRKNWRKGNKKRPISNCLSFACPVRVHGAKNVDWQL